MKIPQSDASGEVKDFLKAHLRLEGLTQTVVHYSCITSLRTRYPRYSKYAVDKSVSQPVSTQAALWRPLTTSTAEASSTGTCS